MPSAQEIVDLAINGQPVEVASQVRELLNQKVADVVELRKQWVAQHMLKKWEPETSIGNAEEPEMQEPVANTEAGVTA